jgi:uncharacterized membrane protein YeaQ/YmgE (transglycosylase-associated protein family)
MERCARYDRTRDERAGSRVGFLTWAIVGIAGGWVARALVKGGRSSLIGDLLTGLAGGIVGGAIFSWFGHLSFWILDIPSIVVAFVGSVMLVLIVRMFTSGKTSA